jgi:hypothetical protein
MAGGGREAAAGWRELRNKLTTFRRVGIGGLGIRRLAGAPLADGVAALYRLDPAATVFRLERLAYERTLAACRRASAPRGILGGEGAAGPPEESLILLHTGLGMAFARVVLRPLRPASPAPRFDAALRRFLDLCRANSRPDYERVAIEALGAAVRMFHARSTAAVDRALARIDPELAALFWHGAGRALYFYGAGLIPRPGSAARQAARCRREPRAAGNRLDALAGLSFALAMVNLRDPEIVELRLAEVGDGAGEAEAFTHGIAACLVARRHTRPEDPAVGAFLAYRPPSSERRRSELWERWVRDPCSDCLERLYPHLLARRRLDALASYSPLAALGG